MHAFSLMWWEVFSNRIHSVIHSKVTLRPGSICRWRLRQRQPWLPQPYLCLSPLNEQPHLAKIQPLFLITFLLLMLRQKHFFLKIHAAQLNLSRSLAFLMSSSHGQAVFLMLCFLLWTALSNDTTRSETQMWEKPSEHWVLSLDGLQPSTCFILFSFLFWAAWSSSENWLQDAPGFSGPLLLATSLAIWAILYKAVWLCAFVLLELKKLHCKV